MVLRQQISFFSKKKSRFILVILKGLFIHQWLIVSGRRRGKNDIGKMTLLRELNVICIFWILKIIMNEEYWSSMRAVVHRNTWSVRGNCIFVIWLNQHWLLSMMNDGMRTQKQTDRIAYWSTYARTFWQPLLWLMQYLIQESRDAIDISNL